MATSSSAAMKSSLVVVLLLSVVVASQAHQVPCKNAFSKAMAFNGVWTGVGMTTVLEVNGVVAVEMYDGKSLKLVGKFKCPEDVKAPEFEHKGGFVKAQITDFSGLGSTLASERCSLYPKYGLLHVVPKIPFPASPFIPAPQDPDVVGDVDLDALLNVGQ